LIASAVPFYRVAALCFVTTLKIARVLVVFLKLDAPASKGPDLSPNATGIALVASVRPHNPSDSDRHDGNPMATIRGGIIGCYKNCILTRRLT
jgi:hypothetical protein